MWDFGEDEEPQKTPRLPYWVQFIHNIQITADRIGDLVLGTRLITLSDMLDENEDGLNKGTHINWNAVGRAFIICATLGLLLDKFYSSGGLTSEDMIKKYGAKYHALLMFNFYSLCSTLIEDFPCSIMTLLYMKYYGMDKFAIANLFLSLFGYPFSMVLYGLDCGTPCGDTGFSLFGCFLLVTMAQPVTLVMVYNLG